MANTTVGRVTVKENGKLSIAFSGEESAELQQVIDSEIEFFSFLRRVLTPEERAVALEYLRPSQ